MLTFHHASVAKPSILFDCWCRNCALVLTELNNLSSIHSLFRSVSPIFAGTVYSVSLTTGLGYPLDYHLIFIIMGGILLVVMVMVAGLPESIERQKDQKESQEQINERDTADDRTANEQEQLGPVADVNLTDRQEQS